jgi:hypothetical protein
MPRRNSRRRQELLCGIAFTWTAESTPGAGFGEKKAGQEAEFGAISRWSERGDPCMVTSIVAR